MGTPYQLLVYQLHQNRTLLKKLSILLELRDNDGFYMLANSTSGRIFDVTPHVLELLESLAHKIKKDPRRYMDRLSLRTIYLLHNMLATWNPACAALPEMSLRFAKVRRDLLNLTEGYRRGMIPVIPTSHVVSMNPVWLPRIGWS